MVSITFDHEAKALYIQIIENIKPAHTIPLGQGHYMDISESGKWIGLEIIFPASIPQEAIDKIIESESDSIKLLVH